MELQNDINAVSKFMDTKLLQFNVSKCKLLFVSKKLSRSLTPPALLLNGSLLQQIQSYKYLGITIASDLSWHPHITICNKTRKLLGLLYRRFLRNASQSTLLKLYTTFVRPHVEYAPIVWSPHFKNEADALEKVQRIALGVCLRQWNLIHEELLQMSTLPMLRSRRTVARLCQLYKILSDMTDFPNSPVEHRDISYSSHSVNSLTLVPFRFRTSLYQFSFSRIQ